jgi:hypothetical protein
MTLFTTGDVLRLTDIPATTFDDWCSKGIIKPISGGQGTGSHRQWTLMLVLGIVAADEIRRSERSCAPAFIGVCVNNFNQVDEAWLKSQFKQGRRYYAGLSVQLSRKPGDTGPMLHEGKEFAAWVDVKAAYDRVVKYVANKG